ncbi:hypothetical protein TRFO_22065 [Tritrichomonas foetus]|uniref:Uncharacterized protein n=1 Tax=Tritrichomonas foetus TaxID=1144522 RepID=A0A1J4KIL2_9EUKA|nr:hypothetical protein TRFO_22065 [Tritrichomonas foetus]|eukprot:OHT09149.1 hypothetical protein TRFO_22065 [Tritrichomonas foetus]
MWVVTSRLRTPYNSVVESKWNLKDDDCIDVDVDLVLRFNDESLQSKLNALLSGSIMLVEPTETSVVVVSTETTVPTLVSMFPVKERKEVKQAIIVIVDTSKHHEKMALLEKERQAARDLQLGMYPKAIASKINIDNNELIFIGKRITLVAIQLANMNDILQAEDPPAKLALFRRKVMETINPEPNGDHVKTLGSFEFVIFNITGGSEIIETYKQAIEFCRKLSNILKEDQLIAKFGFTSDSKVPMGMLDQNHMSFDVFGRCMHLGKSLANAALPNTIMVDILDCNSVQSIVKTQLTKKEIISKGTKVTAFEYELK